MTDTAPRTHDPVVFADLSDWDIVNNPEHRAAWLELRREGIGGSEAAAVTLGADPWSTAFEVYWSKKGKGDEKEQTRHMEWGHRLEDSIRRWFADVSGLPVIHEKIMYQHPDHPWMLANMDGLVGDDAILECKNTDARHAAAWADGPPLHYTLQTLHYLAVSGRQRAHVAVLIGGNDPQRYIVERDDETIERLIERELRFWEDHVLASVEPPVTARESDADLLNGLWTPEPESQIILPPDGVRELLDLARIKANIKRLEGEKKGCENRVKDMLGAHEAGIGVDGQVLITWKAHDTTSIVPDLVRASYPAVAEECSETKTIRTFLTKVKHEEETPDE